MRHLSHWWAALLLAGLLATAPPAFTLQPAPRDGMRRGFFDYRLPPGAVVEDAVLVTNLGEEPLRLALFPSDAQTAANGGLVYPTQRGTPPAAAGAWLQLERTTLDLEPGATHRVAFRLQVPPDAAGEYVAGIVAQPTEVRRSDGDFGVTLIARVAVAVRVRVAPTGALQGALRLESVSLAGAGYDQALRLRLVNTGARGVKGDGQVRVTTPAGEVLRTAAWHLDYTLPGDMVTPSVPLSAPLFPGEYVVEVSFRDAEGLNFTARRPLTVSEPLTPWPTATSLPAPATTASATPWVGLLIAVLLLVVLAQAIWIYRLRRR